MPINPLEIRRSFGVRLVLTGFDGSANSLSSKMRYRIPTSTIREPPSILLTSAGVHERFTSERVSPYMSGTFSVLFAGRRLKMLIRRHENAQVAESAACFWRKVSPVVTGKTAAITKSIVNTSR